ncbi:hypothetical protein VNO78_06755 [Psophocarpus tetragonolobus]|uniref:E3 ubiquitin-protein ligase RMA n=1 Tax=Psophocarpus tetragonolobus TaxID=3891 RepID=A0AAN9SU03_PSOTE
MELDLNQEPSNPTHPSQEQLDSLLEELESTQEHVQERIRRLEVITSRGRQYQRRPLLRTPIQTTNFTGQASARADAHNEGIESQEVEERVFENGKGCKRKRYHLIGKALGVEADASDEGGSSRDFYDCNICLDRARDPILTCCGHLFCWPCFYRVPYASRNARECPVCKGELTENGIIPIYGNTSDNGRCDSGLEAGLKIPPRPAAPRMESFRQQLISQGVPSSIIQHIQQINDLIGGLGVQFLSQNPNTTTHRNNSLLVQPRPQIGNGRSTASSPSPISTLLVQRATSFSSLYTALSSAMQSAERLVEDLESYIHVNRNSIPNVNVAATNSTNAPFVRNVVDTTPEIFVEIMGTNSNREVETSLLDHSSSQSGSTYVSSSGPVSNDSRRRRTR